MVEIPDNLLTAERKAREAYTMAHQAFMVAQAASDEARKVLTAAEHAVNNHIKEIIGRKHV